MKPARDCALCPRLVAYRDEQKQQHPDWFNAPVPSFGDPAAWLAVVGLAPGLKGANRTGRPFTGDDAGGLLFKTLARAGLAIGTYDARPDDGLVLRGAIIINPVRCVPPQNRPTADEINSCRRFLKPEFDGLANLTTIIALGTISHATILRAYGQTPGHFKFGHGTEHQIPGGPDLIDSYHCSRYNQNTKRLTPAMFDAVFTQAIARRG